MPLSDIELRALGALVEKERTTPDAYPLSMPALVAACNQLTNRDPVTGYHLQEVRDAMQRLRDRGLAATVQEVRDRVPKQRHQLARALTGDATELALLACLMLRGPQTAAELRARAERYGGIPDLAGVEAALGALANRDPALVRNVGRSPGQSQDRWSHTLGVDEGRLQPRVRPANASAIDPAPTRSETHTAEPGVHGDQDVDARLAALEARVADLEARLRHDG
ncbi:MAG: DUF480 domain-containing protein [bacterium]|nr:DUF480 domain-containing protein [bacterium]